MSSEQPKRWLDRITGSIEYLYNYIDEGEHQQQDFKFRIDSTRKIAITLSAFANTDGGRLLIGVKDNGKITGIDPEEEYYMIEGAAQRYCKPALPFETQVFENEEGKRVLAVSLGPSPQRPHAAKNAEGQWRVYIRQDDQNFAANRVVLKYLENKNPATQRKNMVAYGEDERALFDLLSRVPLASISQFSRVAHLDIPRAEEILVLFLQWKIIGYKATEKGIRFFLLP